ncbi:MAG: sulfur oxidation c-type cytochrome SoxA [Rhodobiaceae bacterium]|nr:sulfur oxidation c-type cytochrome SoxA [Rhodobiaceae bacterium]MCC0053875.1 sulfur oxidation c-type cytochrome SoxA [Rhodobiaceae bacterium]
MKGWTYGAFAAVFGLCAAGVFALTAPVDAQDDKPLTIDGETLASRVKAPEGSPLAPDLISGWHYRTSETQALQTDDFQNPGFLWVEQGEQLWSAVDGSEGKSCQSCHGDASDSMKGVRAAMPKWSEKAGKPQTLEQHINLCRTERMGAEAWKWESDQMLGMTSYVGLQSRGMPMHVQTDGPMASWVDKGKELYYQRTGQLDMSCANCHEENNGKFIRADFLSQGHLNGFPTYRLKWQKVGSIHRRLKGCINDTRATPYDVGSDELIALELYVSSRGEGLAIESPSVRQ